MTIEPVIATLERAIEIVGEARPLDFPMEAHLREAVRLLRLLPELKKALEHMQYCGSCAEDSWNICEGGRAALAALSRLSASE